MTESWKLYRNNIQDVDKKRNSLVVKMFMKLQRKKELLLKKIGTKFKEAVKSGKKQWWQSIFTLYNDDVHENISSAGPAVTSMLNSVDSSAYEVNVLQKPKEH